MTKVVVNKCYGGFGLSDKARSRYCELARVPEVWDYDVDRFDPYLVQVVEELGDAASGKHAKLKIVEIPDEIGDNWHISEYDGIEHIAETHRTWG